MQALLDNLELLARRDHAPADGALRVSMPTICTDMIAEIRALDPKPGADVGHGPLQPVMPGRADARAAGRRAGSWN